MSYAVAEISAYAEMTLIMWIAEAVTITFANM